MTGAGIHIPTLQTARLILRAPRLSDFDRWAEFFASERSKWERGPLDRVEGYRAWAADVALWTLRGYGAFGMDDRATGAYVGEVGIYQSAEFPAPELGWFVVPEAEGKGYAFEGATAVMAWVREALGWDRLCSIIDPGNVRSIALGRRLGGVIDPALPGIDPGDVVIRHDLRVPA